MPSKTKSHRHTPTLFYIFLIDQSGSMAEKFGESGISKADSVADTVNHFLGELVSESVSGESFQDTSEVSILGYGAYPGATTIAFGGHLSGKEIAKISEIANSPSRIEDKVMTVADGAGGIVKVPTQFPVWLEPIAGNDTPMTSAFHRAYNLVKQWAMNHPDSLPPIVINITDGEPTDGDPTPYAQKIKSTFTKYGHTLVLNCFITSDASNPIFFPNKPTVLQDSYSKKMFKMSSELPQSMVQAVKQINSTTNNSARGLVYQAGLNEMIQFVKVGSRLEEFRLGTRPVDESDRRITHRLFGDYSVVVVDNPSSEITFLTSENQKLTPIFLQQAVTPYIIAIADIQKVINEVHNNQESEVVIRSVTQNSPISVSLDGASEAIKTIQDNVVTWRRENAKILSQQQISENEITIEVLKAETLEKRANAAKSRAEAEKISVEAEKQRQETERLRLENQKIRIEIERAKVQLALDIIDRINPNISVTEKITYVVKLLSPLDVIAFSKLEISVSKES